MPPQPYVYRCRFYVSTILQWVNAHYTIWTDRDNLPEIMHTLVNHEKYDLMLIPWTFRDPSIRNNIELMLSPNSFVAEAGATTTSQYTTEHEMVTQARNRNRQVWLRYPNTLAIQPHPYYPEPTMDAALVRTFQWIRQHNRRNFVALPHAPQQSVWTTGAVPNYWQDVTTSDSPLHYQRYQN